jgi:glycosyltransferase involved in cell wall biosynthesis
MTSAAYRTHAEPLTGGRQSLKLLIAIPALNEEDCIEQIIERTLRARDTIVAQSPVTEVEITVVSDGSTDRTVERAQRYAHAINLIVFEQNRGYGAAIKAAWADSDADLLAFLDADGTCDPELFADFCARLDSDHADVVLGSRLNPDSRMPLIRRIGNAIFATMLTAFSSKVVRDTASGMRVVRRSSLPALFPLPDGLHFTPAMSARAMLGENIRIVEVPMSYAERVGESKLRIGKDGVRFLKAILDAAFLFRPSRPLALMGLLSLAAATLFMIRPTVYYLQHRSVLEWMIYRFIVSNLLATCSCLLLCTSYLSAHVVRLTLGLRPRSRWHGVAERFFSSRYFWLAPTALMVAGGLLVLPSFLQLVRTGGTYEHWSRFVAMSVCVEIAVILVATRLLDYTLSLIQAQLEFNRTGA